MHMVTVLTRQPDAPAPNHGLFVKNELKSDVQNGLSEADFRQSIVERLWKRNWVRHQIGLPPINITALYSKKIAVWRGQQPKGLSIQEEYFREEKTN